MTSPTARHIRILETFALTQNKAATARACLCSTSTVRRTLHRWGGAVWDYRRVDVDSHDGLDADTLEIQFLQNAGGNKDIAFRLMAEHLGAMTRLAVSLERARLRLVEENGRLLDGGHG